MLEMNSQSWVESLEIILDTDCTARDLRIPESQHESSQGYLSRPECEGTVWSTLAQHWHTTPPLPVWPQERSNDAPPIREVSSSGMEVMSAQS